MAFWRGLTEEGVQWYSQESILWIPIQAPIILCYLGHPQMFLTQNPAAYSRLF